MRWPWRWAFIAVALVAVVAVPTAARLWLTSGPQLGLDRPPYLGIACQTPNATSCDRVRLAVFLTDRAEELMAELGGRRFRMEPTDWPGRPFASTWEGDLQPAGLLRTLPETWTGDPPVRVALSLRAVFGDGATASRIVQVTLAPGYG